MKTLIALSMLVGVPSFAVQYIDCIPMPYTNNDHVIVSLKDQTTGTLFLSSGINDDGSHDNSGILELKFVRNEKDQAVFNAHNSISDFEFSMPANLIQVRFMDYFTANIGMTLTASPDSASQTLSCFTRLY